MNARPFLADQFSDHERGLKALDAVRAMGGVAAGLTGRDGTAV